MTSQKKIEANRGNSLRSTGPRSAAGKERSRRNAFKHGLAVSLNRDASFAGRVETFMTDLAQLFAEPSDTLRQVAERQTEVERIQQTRLAMINRRLGQQVGAADDAASAEARSAAGVAAALPELARLDRYERRALSRLRKVLRSFENE